MTIFKKAQPSETYTEASEWAPHCIELIQIHDAGIRYLAVLKLVDPVFKNGLSIFGEREMLDVFYREVGAAFTNLKDCIDTENEIRKLVPAAKLEGLSLTNTQAKKTAEKALEILHSPSLWEQYVDFFNKTTK